MPTIDRPLSDCRYTGLVQFKDGKIGAGFDDGGPFPPNYPVGKGAAVCKGQTANETFVLIELSKPKLL